MELLGVGGHGNLSLVFEKSFGEVGFFIYPPLGKIRFLWVGNQRGRVWSFTLFPFQTHLLSLDTCLRFYNSDHMDTASKPHNQNSYLLHIAESR